ncbi:chorismate lyase [Chitinimonas sp.]|uniref:chorismate--pyruvate lyase family protein n=1 Tax=Chitinimonas sp. TaxID=1934313 RepID=UPI0035AF543C
MPHIASHRWGQPACQAPRALRDWLVHTGSLTIRLTARFPQFRVCLLRQHWALPNRDELRALGLARREMAMVRDVVLMSGDTPLVFAHSVMPRQALFHGFGRLRQQGCRSLGATLFANPKIRRGKLAFRCLDRHHRLHAATEAAVGRVPARLWARRSRFELGQSRILVTEVMLPAVLESMT